MPAVRHHQPAHGPEGLELLSQHVGRRCGAVKEQATILEANHGRANALAYPAEPYGSVEGPKLAIHNGGERAQRHADIHSSLHLNGTTEARRHAPHLETTPKGI